MLAFALDKGPWSPDSSTRADLVDGADQRLPCSPNLAHALAPASASAPSLVRSIGNGATAFYAFVGSVLQVDGDLQDARTARSSPCARRVSALIGLPPSSKPLASSRPAAVIEMTSGIVDVGDYVWTRLAPSAQRASAPCLVQAPTPLPPPRAPRAPGGAWDVYVAPSSRSAVQLAGTSLMVLATLALREPLGLGLGELAVRARAPSPTVAACRVRASAHGLGRGSLSMSTWSALRAAICKSVSSPRH